MQNKSAPFLPVRYGCNEMVQTAPNTLCSCAVTWAFVLSRLPLLSMTTSANFSLSASDELFFVRQ